MNFRCDDISVDGVRNLRRRIDRWLTESRCDHRDQQAIVLTLTEVCTNIVEHARPAPTLIEVDVSGGNGDWVLDVTDDGAPFEGYERAMSAADAIGDETMRDGGLGLHLVGKHFRSCRYIRGHQASDGLNRLSLCQQIGHAEVVRARIVVIDDDPVMHKLATAYLSDRFDVTSFSNGPAAIAALREMRADLIICDISMPGMDGLEVRRRLSREAKTDICPFVFLTGAGIDATTEQRAAELGIDDYLTKPIKKQRLLNVVDRLLQRARQVRVRLGPEIDAAVTAALRPSLPARIGPYLCGLESYELTPGGGDLVIHHRAANHDDLILADIMGHGVSAKFAAHAYAAYLRGLVNSAPTGLEVSDLLSRLAQDLKRDNLMDEVTATCLAIRLHDNGTVDIASAGHPLPLLQADNEVREIGFIGSLPAVGDDARYITSSVTLRPTDRLYAFTDGLVERRRPDVSDKSAFWLSSAILAASRLPLRAAVAQIAVERRTALNWSPEDDMTLLAIERIEA